MKDKSSLLNPMPEKVPSPEELFHNNNLKLNNPNDAVSVTIRKPIPRYRIVKPLSIGFCIFIILLTVFMMNLDKLGINFYFMRSSSMESIIPKGSILVTKKVPPDQLFVGDIITYNNIDGKSVTHKIENITPSYQYGQPGYITKGSDNGSVDNVLVSYKDVRGKVIFHIPYIGRIFLGRNGGA